MWTLTPAMQQYIDMKMEHPDCILLFRLGDFYEMFWEDAKIASKLLDLTLTSKNKNADNPIPMAGVPYHSVDKYIQKLIESWYKVAIAEQTSTPQAGKLVNRAISTIFTPGNYVQETSPEHNYCVAIIEKTYNNGDRFHCARWDFSLWCYYTKSFPNREDIIKHILLVQPSEIVIQPDNVIKQSIQDITQQLTKCIVSLYENNTNRQETLKSILKIESLEWYGEALSESRWEATTLLLSYLKQMQKSSNTIKVHSISYHHSKQTVLIDQTSIKNLELFNSNSDNNKKHSLYWVVNTTNTPMGARMLKEWLLEPSKEIHVMQRRLDTIEYYINHPISREKIIDTLKNVYDIPKIVTTILYHKNVPSLYGKLRYCLEKTLDDTVINACIENGSSESTISTIKDIYTKLKTTIKEEITNESIDYINDWVETDIDRLRDIAYHSDQLLISYQQEICKKAQSNNIKIKYVSNVWYVIEVTPKDTEKLEAVIAPWDQKFDFIRRQTLKTGQRYSSSYLEEIQIGIITAKEQLVQHESAILENLKKNISWESNIISQRCEDIAYIDITTSHALFAQQQKLCRPTYNTTWTTNIQQGRHIVIENTLKHGHNFIPNNLIIDSSKNENNNGYIHIITGPNMWGKSTYLRQNALIILMAQCWLYVPATSAQIKTVDAIFARVGSGDAITKNQSTFMTEMIEVSAIINNASANSFIIFDELGRGTATYDGLAISKAILEYLSEKVKAQTLIATHYHELIQLEKRLPWIVNFSASVYETDKEVVFLKKIVAGWADKSYGIEVAKLAWLPQSITKKAEQYLSELEEAEKTKPPHEKQLFTQVANHTKTEETWVTPLELALDSIDLENTTPLQALYHLQNLKEKRKRS